jgi:hypothetical protein
MKDQVMGAKMYKKQIFQTVISVGMVALIIGCAGKMNVPVNSSIEKFDYGQGVAAFNERNYEKALDIWAEMANQGDSASVNALGMMYQSGKGVARDVGAAARLYKKAAQAGLPAAQNNLAVLYEGGEGVPQDLVKAVDLYRRAAAQGYVWAQYNLGRLHASGSGVNKDAAMASDFFDQADQTKNSINESVTVLDR